MDITKYHHPCRICRVLLCILIMPSVTASFIILERAIGQSLDQVYHSLNEKQISNLVDKLVEIYAQLHSKKWSQIGGLNVDDQGIIVPGPVLEETSWKFPDIGARTNPLSL